MTNTKEDKERVKRREGKEIGQKSKTGKENITANDTLKKRHMHRECEKSEEMQNKMS